MVHVHMNEGGVEGLSGYLQSADPPSPSHYMINPLVQRPALHFTSPERVATMLCLAIERAAELTKIHPMFIPFTKVDVDVYIIQDIESSFTKNLICGKAMLWVCMRCLCVCLVPCRSLACGEQEKVRYVLRFL